MDEWIYISRIAAGANLSQKGDIEQVKYSEIYYNAIRNRHSKSDIEAIVKHTNFTYNEIAIIREHIFIKEHNLGDGVLAYLNLITV